jgi:phage gpG-like protein
MTGLTVTIPDVLRLKKTLPTVNDIFNLAKRAETIIKIRTAAGQDVNGSPFHAYPKQYKNQRAREGLPVSVDLKYTGSMLRNMTVKKIANGAEIFFINDQRGMVAAIHTLGTEKMPQREFLGLSEAELTRLNDQLAVTLQKRAGK